MGIIFSRAAFRGAAGLLLACVLLAAAAEADVRRRITVRSNPPGALVYIDDQQIGATPASTSFVYYGTRKVQLIKDGFKTVTVLQTFSPPWYEVPPFDFFSENIYSGELRDERVLDFEMEPETIPPTNELRERAESLRASARAGVIAPPPLAAPVGGVPPGMLAPTYAPPGGMAAPIAAPQFTPPPQFAPQPQMAPSSPELLPPPAYPGAPRYEGGYSPPTMIPAPGVIRPLPPP